MRSSPPSTALSLTLSIVSPKSSSGGGGEVKGGEGSARGGRTAVDPGDPPDQSSAANEASIGFETELWKIFTHYCTQVGR